MCQRTFGSLSISKFIPVLCHYEVSLSPADLFCFYKMKPLQTTVAMLFQKLQRYFNTTLVLFKQDLNSTLVLFKRKCRRDFCYDMSNFNTTLVLFKHLSRANLSRANLRFQYYTSPLQTEM